MFLKSFFFFFAHGSNRIKILFRQNDLTHRWDTTTPGQSIPGSNGYEGVLYTPHIFPELESHHSMQFSVVAKTLVLLLLLLLASLWVFITSFSWWSFDGIWVTAGLFSIFWPILIILLSIRFRFICWSLHPLISTSSLSLFNLNLLFYCLLSIFAYGVILCSY